MTISAYQVDNVIRAYNKQSKTNLRLNTTQASSPDRYTDVVTLSTQENVKVDAYRKISYSLMDVLLKKIDNSGSQT